MTMMHHLRLRGCGSAPAVGRGGGLDFIQWAFSPSKSLLDSRRGTEFGEVCVWEGGGGVAVGERGRADLTMKSYTEKSPFLEEAKC